MASSCRPGLIRCVPGAFHGRVPGPVWPAEGSHSPWTGFRGPLQSLYKALSGERSPSFDTILKVVSALRLKLSASVSSEAEVT